MVNKLIKKIRNWFVIRLDRWIEFGEVRKKLLKFNYMDIFLIFVFICFACLFTLAQLQINFPMVRLSSDGSIVMSYAAAEKYPSHFSTDPYLSNPKNFATYSSILLPLVKWLEPLVGNFSLAEMVILFPVVLLYLIGFYFLGKAYFNNRAWALFFTFLNSIPLIIPLEVYGLFYEPLPRFIFTALLPYVLLMVWQFKG
jgi:hypothetical protein